MPRLALGAFDEGYEPGQCRSGVVSILVNFSDNEIGAVLITLLAFFIK